MAKIKVLDKHIAELIAAGEVVERPSSVIKELMENSIDAGASVITVEIRNGGISFMRITDNGSGIPRDEVPTAFLRHATSKIDIKDDLDSIATLGFRGEALASISAVSRIEMLTKTKNEIMGMRYTINDGGESLEEAGCPDGTTIIVRDLFYNTPARMKFLKRDITEGNAVSGIVDKIAFSHPEVSVRFIRDGKEQLHTPGDNKLISAIYAVYGKEFGSSLIPVDYSLAGIDVKGYVSLPSATRATRTMQNFFINDRFIRSRTAAAALEEAYKGSIMVGKFPACVLKLSLSYEAVDVNVHPAKLEVRFVNEKPIFEAVYHGVKTALTTKDRTQEIQFKKPVPPPYTPVEKHENMMIDTAVSKPYDTKTSLRDSAISGESFITRNITKSRIETLIDTEPQKEYDTILCKQEETKAAEVQKEPEKEQKEFSQTQDLKPVPEIFTKLIGEAFDTYIILQYGSEALMLIDKHAAHERLLYEKLKRENSAGVSQTLLEPIVVTLDKDEYSAVISNLDVMENAGFMTEDFGTGSVIVRSAPLLLEGQDVSSAVMEIAGYLSSFKTDITTEHLDWVYHNVACRAAIKGGNHSTEAELIALAKLLEENPDIRYCPHGRPISMIIKRKDLEKQFGRIQ